MSTNDTVQVIVRMPRELHEAFKARAEAEERSVAAAIRHACRCYLQPDDHHRTDDIPR